MKHTKGPWALNSRNFGEYFDLVTNEPTPTFISKISGQNEANAQLIAAAPEMLELLEYIRDNEILDMDNEPLYRLINKAKGVVE